MDYRNCENKKRKLTEEQKKRKSDYQKQYRKNMTEEQKQKLRDYQKNRYNNMTEEQKQKLKKITKNIIKLEMKVEDLVI